MQIFMQFYVFCLLINIEIMLDYLYCMFFDFFLLGVCEREKIFYMIINFCFRIKLEEWSFSEVYVKFFF